jgi:hypothetical protein
LLVPVPASTTLEVVLEASVLGCSESWSRWLQLEGCREIGPSWRIWSDQRWIVSESGPGQFQSICSIPDTWINFVFLVRRISAGRAHRLRRLDRRNRHWRIGVVGRILGAELRKRRGRRPGWTDRLGHPDMATPWHSGGFS